MNSALIPPDDPRWIDLIERTAHDTYQRPGYATLCARLEGGDARALWLACEDGELLIPLVTRELPALGDPSLEGWRDAVSPYGYPGVLVRGTWAEGLDRARQCLLDELKRHRILSLFVRANPMRPETERVLEALGTPVDSGDTVFMALELSENEIWRGMRPDHRRQIRQLKAKGYSSLVDEWSHLEHFRNLYRGTMRRVAADAHYHFDDGYFETLRAVEERMHIVSVVGPTGGIAAAGLYFACDGVVYAHLTGTSDEEPSANKILYDCAWRWAKSLGEKALFVGGGIGRQNDPLLFYKRGFSRLTRTYRTFRVVVSQATYERTCAAAGVSSEGLTGFFPAYRQPSPRSNVEVEPSLGVGT